jgi:hypothetical protein
VAEDCFYPDLHAPCDVGTAKLVTSLLIDVFTPSLSEAISRSSVQHPQSTPEAVWIRQTSYQFVYASARNGHYTALIFLNMDILAN